MLISLAKWQWSVTQFLFGKQNEEYRICQVNCRGIIMCMSWWMSYWMLYTRKCIIWLQWWQIVERRNSRFQSSLLVSFSTWVIWSLAAHVGIFHLHTEQSPICTHAELVPLHALIEIHISCRVRDACSIEHDWSIEDDAVLLQRQNP